ncbi:hypothetical protein GCM10029978_091510 [Actinoallomurus acanthiterrae]
MPPWSTFTPGHESVNSAGRIDTKQGGFRGRIPRRYKPGTVVAKMDFRSVTLPGDSTEYPPDPDAGRQATEWETVAV